MKSKNKNTTKRMETSATSTSSTSTKVSTTIDTLKRFWRQNWHRILSAFAVLLVVCSIAFSCGVNAKAYETSPPSFVPFSVTAVIDENNVSNASVDPNGYLGADIRYSEFDYNIFGITNSVYSATIDTETTYNPLREAFVFPIEFDLSILQCISEDLNLTLNVLDVYPFIENGYRPSIQNGSDVIITGGPSLSTLKNVYLAYHFPEDVDYSPRPAPCTVTYSYVDEDSGIIRTGSFKNSIHLNESVALDQTQIDHYNVYDSLDLSILPSSAWLTGVQIDLHSVVRDYTDSHDDSSLFYLEVVQLEREPSHARTAERFLASVISPTLFVPDNVGSYQEGYIDGLNKGQTESLGVVDWLVDAGDAFMNFQLFTVASTPVTVGTLFSVIIGTFLLFFILRIFAGG